jgi:hypothetical protein
VTMSLEQKASRLEEQLVKLKRESLVSRVNVLFASGRITRPMRDKLLTEASAAQLSLDDAGELKDARLLAKVEALEELPATFAPADRLSQNGDGVTAVDAPAGMRGPPQTKAEVDAAVDDFEQLVGRGKSR